MNKLKYKVDKIDGKLYFKTKGVLVTFMVSFAVKLGTENAGTGYAAENADIKNKHQLIDDGNA